MGYIVYNFIYYTSLVVYELSVVTDKRLRQTLI